MKNLKIIIFLLLIYSLSNAEQKGDEIGQYFQEYGLDINGKGISKATLHFSEQSQNFVELNSQLTKPVDIKNLLIVEGLRKEIDEIKILSVKQAHLLARECDLESLDISESYNTKIFTKILFTGSIELTKQKAQALIAYLLFKFPSLTVDKIKDLVFDSLINLSLTEDEVDHVFAYFDLNNFKNLLTSESKISEIPFLKEYLSEYIISYNQLVENELPEIENHTNNMIRNTSVKNYFAAETYLYKKIENEINSVANLLTIQNLIVVLSEYQSIDDIFWYVDESHRNIIDQLKNVDQEKLSNMGLVSIKANLTKTIKNQMTYIIETTNKGSISKKITLNLFFAEDNLINDEYFMNEASTITQLSETLKSNKYCKIK